jgi:hypothetical protein
LIGSPTWLSNLTINDQQGDPSVRAISHSKDIDQNIKREFHLAGIYPEKMSPALRDSLVKAGIARSHPHKLTGNDKSVEQENLRLSRIHPDKVSEELKRLLGYRAEYDGEWFLVDSRFASVYMTALATMLAQEAKLSPLTTREPYQGLALRCLIDEVISEGRPDARGTLLTLVMESLRIDPDTSVAKLISFRRARADQLSELSAMFDDLKTTIEKSENREELEHIAQKMFENKIRPGMEKLKKELSDNTIQSAWEGFYQAATFSVGSGSALANYSTMNSATLLGAGAFLTATTVAVKAVFASRKVRRASPYSYLLDIEKKFALPRYV